MIALDKDKVKEFCLMDWVYDYGSAEDSGFAGVYKSGDEIGVTDGRFNKDYAIAFAKYFKLTVEDLK